jgi:hypothetical protein
LLFCLNCGVWATQKINYVFVFELDRRRYLDWRQLTEASLAFTPTLSVTDFIYIVALLTLLFIRPFHMAQFLRIRNSEDIPILSHYPGWAHNDHYVISSPYLVPS